VPAGSEEVVIVKAGGLMVTDSVAVADLDPLSVTFALKFEDPAALGVPVIAPLAARLRPAGKDPLDTDHEYGGDPPAAPRVCE
jgi:hypothetical protein